MMTNRNPLFFFHIPKTAGSTLRGILTQHYEAREIAAAFTWSTLLEVGKRRLSEARLFQGHFYGPLESVVGTHCDTFTILRDPIERALSRYGHVLRDTKHYLHQRAKELGTLDAYIDDPNTQLTISNFQSRMLALNFDVQSYYSKLGEEDRRNWRLEEYIETTDFGLTHNQIFSAAQAKLSTFFLTGITEKFPATLALLCHKMGWTYPEKSANQNINDERPRQDALPEHTLQKLKELNAVDIAIYSSAEVAFENKVNNLLIDAANQNAKGGFLRRLRN